MAGFNRQNSLATCNQVTVREAIDHNTRFDARLRHEWRNVDIVYGRDFGSCMVRLGKTVVLAACSCEITEPKLSRPSEGQITFSLDLFASNPDWLDSYQHQLPKDGVLCLRLLERTLKDSHCFDTESLCLVKGVKVWQVKCDLSCLNFDGNLVETASIAALSALMHFKLPNVAVSADGQVKIYSFEERHPLNLTLLHFPFAVSFAIFRKLNDNLKSNDYNILTDPNQLEEEIADCSLVVAANSYNEVLTTKYRGKFNLDHKTIMFCSRIAAERAKRLTVLVKETFEADQKKRANKEPVGFSVDIGQQFKS